MSRSSRFHALLRSRAGMLLILVPALFLTGSCDDDDIAVIPGLFNLTLSLGADFSAPHGNQPVEWALVQSFDGLVLATGEGTISATSNPAFTLTTGPALEQDVDYELRYWIDSNTGGGTPGVCDPETIDYQWNWRFTAPDNDVSIILLYDANRVEFVCDTFSP